MLSLLAAPSRRRDGPACSSPSRRHCRCREASLRQGPGQRIHRPRMLSPRWHSRTSPRCRTRYLLLRSRSIRRHGSRPCKHRTSQGDMWNRRAAPSRRRDGPSCSSPSHRRCQRREASPRQGPGQRTHRPHRTCPRPRSCTSPRCRSRCLPQGSRSIRKRESHRCKRRRSQGGMSNRRVAPSRRRDDPLCSSPCHRQSPGRAGPRPPGQARCTRRSRTTSPRQRSHTSPRCRTGSHPPRSRNTLTGAWGPCRRRTSQGGT